MIEGIIRWSIANRLLVLILASFLTVAGIYAARQTPIDAQKSLLQDHLHQQPMHC